MVDHGFSERTGPVAVMLADHQVGRAHVRAIAQLGLGEGPLSDAERSLLVEHALSYSSMLRSHIAKEDSILYVFAQRVIPAEEMDDLARQFEQFEREQMGNGEHVRLHQLASLLISEYGPSGSAKDHDSPCAVCGML